MVKKNLTLTKGRIAGAPQNCPLSWRDPGPTWQADTWFQPSRHDEQHLDRFSRFGTVHGCDQQTDRHTHTDQSQRNLGNNRPRFMLCMAMRPNNNNNIPFPAPFHGSAKRKCGFFPQHHGNRVNCRCNQNFVCLAKFSCLRLCAGGLKNNNFNHSILVAWMFYTFDWRTRRISGTCSASR